MLQRKTRAREDKPARSNRNDNLINRDDDPARLIDQGIDSSHDQDPDDEDIEASEYEFTEVDPESISIGYENDVKDWLLKNQLLDNEYVFRVYKYLNNVSGQRKEFIGEWSDYVPGEHEIGMEFGSGRYIGLLNITDNRGKRRCTSCKFRIHKHYDSLRSQSSMNNFFPSRSMVGHAGGGIDGSLETVGKIIQMILPVVQAKPESQGNYGELMNENYRMMNSIMKRSVFDNMQMLNDLQRKNAGLSEVVESEEEATGAMGVINQIMPMVERFLPLIVGKSMPQARATVDFVKTLPEYNQMVKNKAMLKAFCAFVDSKHGRSETDKILARFKVSRPVPVEKVPVQGGPGQQKLDENKRVRVNNKNVSQ